MIIWIVRFIDSGAIVPASVGNDGRSASKAPRTTTIAIAVKKIAVDR